MPLLLCERLLFLKNKTFHSIAISLSKKKALIFCSTLKAVPINWTTKKKNMYYNLVYYIISHWCIIKKYCALMFLIEFMNVMKKIKVFHVKYQSNDNSVQFFCKTYVRSSTVNMIFWQQFMWNMVKTFTTISFTPYKYTNHT